MTDAPTRTEPVAGLDETAPDVPDVARDAVWRRALDSRALEITLSVALVAIGSVYLGQFIHAMATTSLWNDEIWSVLNFSKVGPGESVSSVNNAITLNLVNSVLPGSDSLDPLRVRFVSMVAIVAMQLVGLGELVRRRWYLPGALLFFVLAVNFQWLDTTLQARGYGILGLAAMVAGIAAWRILEGGRTRWLVTLAVASVLGVWTVPSFAFFAGPLWVALLVVRRDRRTLVGAAASGVVLLALYGPLLDDLWSQTSGYSDVFGNQYGTVLAPYRTVRNYLFEREGGSPLTLAWLLAFVAPALVILPGARRVPGPVRGAVRAVRVDAPSASRQAVRCLGAASLAVFVIALVLTTPPQRTVAYVVVPIALATAISLALVRADVRFGAVARGFTLVVAVLACVHGAFAIADLSFTPIEDWDGTVAYLEATFPDGTPVHAAGRAEFTHAYLDGTRFPVVDELDDAAFGAGGQVVAAFEPNGNLDPFRDELVHDFANVVEMNIPQRRGSTPSGGYPLLFAPPTDRLVEQVTVDGAIRDELADGELVTVYERPAQDGAGPPVVVDIDLGADGPVRSLVVLVARGGGPAAVEAEVTTADGTTSTVPADDIVLGRRVITVPLGDREVSSVRLTITAGAAEPVVLQDVWAYAA